MKNKKGAIGATLTWFAATIIVLLIIVLFLVLSGLLFAINEVTSRGEKDDTNIFFSSDNLETQRDLFYVLNYPVADILLIDLILNWRVEGDLKSKEEFSTHLRDLLEKDENKCHLFSVDGQFLYSKDPLLYPRLVALGIPSFEIISGLVVDPSYIRVHEYSIAETNLILDKDEKINVKLYSRKC